MEQLRAMHAQYPVEAAAAWGDAIAALPPQALLAAQASWAAGGMPAAGDVAGGGVAGGGLAGGGLASGAGLAHGCVSGSKDVPGAGSTGVGVSGAAAGEVGCAFHQRSGGCDMSLQRLSSPSEAKAAVSMHEGLVHGGATQEQFHGEQSHGGHAQGGPGLDPLPHSPTDGARLLAQSLMGSCYSHSSPLGHGVGDDLFLRITEDALDAFFEEDPAAFNL